jgi:spore coat polysaccharide biosynthesis protein SpsF
MGSTRLPGKVLLELCGKPVLWHIVERCLLTNAAQVIVATTDRAEDDVIESFCKIHSVNCFRGSENDVLSRYTDCAEKFGAEIILRVTGDCPMLDAEVINLVLNKYCTDCYDYVSNVGERRTYPRGLDIEVVSVECLKKILSGSDLKESDREHVTMYIRNRLSEFAVFTVENNIDLSYHRWTLDTAEDWHFIREVFTRLFYKKQFFCMSDVLEILKAEPELLKINAHVEQKAG